jgi:hypothetical protein
MCQVEKSHTAGSGGIVTGGSGEPCVRWKNLTQLGQEELSLVGQENHVSGGKISHSWVRRNSSLVGQEKHVSGGKTSHSWVRRKCLRWVREPCCQVEKRHTAGSGGTVIGRSGEPRVRWKNVTKLGQEELSYGVRRTKDQVEKRHTAGSGGTVLGRSGEPCCQVEKRHTSWVRTEELSKGGQENHVTKGGQEKLSHRWV